MKKEVSGKEMRNVLQQVWDEFKVLDDDDFGAYFNRAKRTWIDSLTDDEFDLFCDVGDEFILKG